MASLLGRALDLLEDKKLEEALEALIDAWRDQRAPTIARAVDEVDAMLALTTFSGPAATWKTAAKEAKTSAARGSLVRAIQPMTMADILDCLPVALKWNDPRVGTLVIAMLRELRFTGKRSQTFWRDVFATIPEQRDPRFIELVPTLPNTWNIGELKSYLTKQLTDATKTLEKVRLREADERALSKILASIQQRSSSSKSAQTGESLLADIYARPADDEPRAVYADWLLERNDPRGELIALQLRPDHAKDKAAKKREKDLLKAHQKEWLGALAPIVGGELEFRRGFLAAATLKFKSQKDVETFGERPEWATLEELDWGSHIVRADQREWSRWIGPSMKNVRVAVRPLAKHLLAGEVSWSIEDLELWTSENELDAETYRQLLKSARLPKLRRVFVMGGNNDPGWLEDVRRCPPVLEFRKSLDSDERAGWLAAAEKTAATTFIFNEYGGSRHHFTRDDKGKFTRLETVMVPPTKATSLTPPPRPLDLVLEALRKLPNGSLTHFNATIELGGQMVPATPAIDAAARLVRA